MDCYGSNYEEGVCDGCPLETMCNTKAEAKKTRNSQRAAFYTVLKRNLLQRNKAGDLIIPEVKRTSLELISMIEAKNTYDFTRAEIIAFLTDLVNDNQFILMAGRILPKVMKK